MCSSEVALDRPDFFMREAGGREVADERGWSGEEEARRWMFSAERFLLRRASCCSNVGLEKTESSR